MPNGFYFTLGFFAAFLIVCVLVPDTGARKWARRTTLGAILGGLIVAGIMATVQVWS